METVKQVTVEILFNIYRKMGIWKHAVLIYETKVLSYYILLPSTTWVMHGSVHLCSVNAMTRLESQKVWPNSQSTSCFPYKNGKRRHLLW